MRALSVLGLLVVLMARAHALAPRIEVRTPPASGLCAAVRVQLSGKTEVRCGPRDPARPAPALTVWLTHPLAEEGRTLVARDAHGNRRRQSLGIADGPELERAVALKISEWWAHPQPAPAPAPTLNRGHAYAVGGLGSTLTGPVGDLRVQPALWIALGLGVRFEARSLRLELAPALQLGMRSTWEDPPRALTLTDRGIGAWTALLWSHGKLDLGPWGQILAHRVTARSRVNDARDRHARTLWGLAAGLALRARWVDWLHVEAAVGIEGLPHRQRYRVAGEPLADLGHVRALGRLTLLVHFRRERGQSTNSLQPMDHGRTQ